MAGRKANFHWEAFPGVAGTIWASTVSNAVSMVDIGTFDRSGTLRRALIDFFLYVPTLSAATSSGRAGLIIVAPQVAAVGATAVPRPITDAERPWIWNRAYATNQEATTAGNTKDRLYHAFDDVRGMRKYKTQDHLIFVLENAVGAVVETMCSVRALEST